MQNKAIQLTNHELKLVQESDFLLTKRKVVDKVVRLFQECGSSLQSLHLFNEHSPYPYKITKGENLQLLPYVVLDYPQISGPDFPYLCRTLFWWGNYFSLQLYVRKDYVAGIDWSKETQTEKRVYQGKNLWEHDIRNIDFRLYTETDRTKIWQTGYIKMGMTLPLEKFSMMETAMMYYKTHLMEGLELRTQTGL